MPAPYHHYFELYADAMNLYQEQRFADALDLLTREGERFPDEGHLVLYLRSCLAARVGQPDSAIQLLQEALDRGYWYGEQAVRESPSWQVLQGDPGFERLAQVCLAREAEAQGEPQLFVQEPDGGCSEERPCPLFIALHGNTDNGLNARRRWSAITSRGWLLASLQSSHAAGYQSYVWDDQDRALREVAEHYAQLASRYLTDQARVVLAGFSMGGETALRASLNGTIPAAGFVLLGPGGPTIDEPDAWLPLIEQGKHRGLRGYVLLGELDNTLPQEAIRRLVDMLNDNGIPCGLEVIPGLRHDYPIDFDPIIGRALAFTLGQGRE